MKQPLQTEIAKLDRELRDKSNLAVKASRARWRERTEERTGQHRGRITFLGTGGSPEAVIGQEPRTAGFTIELGDLYLYVDPGPSALPGAVQLGLDLGTLDGVYISHGHTDHYAGAETVIEAMCWAMSVRRGCLLAPKSVLEVNHNVSRFHSGHTDQTGYSGGPETVFLEAGKPVELKGVKLTPVKAYHAGENYGFILDYQGFKLGYTSDTSYITAYRNGAGIQQIGPSGAILDLEEIVAVREDLQQAFREVDLLIANVTTHNVWLHRHITSIGLAHLLKGSRVKRCLLTHFNYCCVQPEDLRSKMGEYVTKVSGVEAIPVYDLQQVDILNLVEDCVKVCEE